MASINKTLWTQIFETKTQIWEHNYWIISVVIVEQEIQH